MVRFCIAHNKLTAAQRAGARHLGSYRLGVFTFRITRTGKEFSESSGLYDHFPAAQLADLVGLLIRHLDISDSAFLRVLSKSL